MSVSSETGKPEADPGQTFLGLFWHYAGGRRGLLILAADVVGAGLYSSWGWLAAIGVAPLLLALAPCAAMCALGLCMSRGIGKSSSAESKAADQGTKGGAIAKPEAN